ncbi:MAG: winged helix-turn-helix domain-containing protein [Sandaracinaceae bacterium]|nr:winged helix-turn-helix domain-containing protein [Sandaracinaceae bacterium]
MIREHVATVRQRAAVAVERAFSASPKQAPSRRSTAARSTSSRRRPPDEIAALGERLYRAICAHPGASMAVLAPHVGATARELNRPAQLLRRTGRVRSVGQRQATRYFPMAPKT